MHVLFIRNTGQFYMAINASSWHGLLADFPLISDEHGLYSHICNKIEGERAHGNPLLPFLSGYIALYWGY